MSSKHAGEKAKSSKENGTEHAVVLKPIFGLAPGIYLTILYSAILLAIFIAVFIVPGLMQRGEKILIETQPSAAAVRLNDVYRGISPCVIFAGEGSHTITLAGPGLIPQDIQVESRARVFASLFRRPKQRISVKLVPKDPVTALAAAASEYAQWSLAGKPEETWQIPLVLSDAAWRMGPYLGDNQNRVQGIIRASARFARWPIQLRDLLRASFLVDNRGLPPSPISALETGRSWLQWLSENPDSPLVLSSILEGVARDQILTSSWYAKASTGKESNAREPLVPSQKRRIGGIEFIALPNHPSLGGSWYIARDEIQNTDWLRFINEEKEWAAENREALIEKGLVSPEYLLGYEGISAPGSARHSVSYYAAKAWCQWFEEGLPSSMVQWQVRLPSEEEWEEAARMASSAGIVNMTDSLWEWCWEPWVHYPRLSADKEAIELVSSPMRPLKGGSWANRPGSVRPDSRGAQSPDSCNPWTGFRPVIVPRETP